MPDVAAASTAETAAPAAKSGPSLRQLLLVPAIVVPLISAVPVWFDKGVAVWKDYTSGSARDAEQQNAIANRNISCLSSPRQFYQSGKLAIDGTICKTGDVLVRVFNQTGEGALYWVPSEVLNNRIDYSRSKVVAAPVKPAALSRWSNGGNPAAYLRPAVAGSAWGQPSPYFQLTQAGQVTVLCTTKIDDRHIRQRIRRPDGCFDQVIDLANGAVVSVTSAPCQC